MKPAEEVIKYLYPELIIKKKNADIFLKFRSTFKGIAGLGRGNFLDEKTLKIREECLKELRILNKKPYNEGKPFRGNVKSLRN